MQGRKWTAGAIRALKGREKLACLSLYDYATARIADEAGIPLLLVGDSLAMSVMGLSTTLPVTMELMLHHTAAVARGATRAMVVADMPFMSYQADVAEGMRNAARFLAEAGAAGVKIEGGACRAGLVRALVDNGIPVLGHIGLTPQSVHTLNGYKVQGRDAAQAAQLAQDAVALEQAGAFAIVIECVPVDVAVGITQGVGVPTIGIGAGSGCDGQILVAADLLGLQPEWKPRFVKRYAELGDAMRVAFSSFREDVEAGRFPTPEQGY